jgi:phosphatidylglycerophosphatase A
MAKSSVEKRRPDGFIDYLALAITTCGVGYLPLAPGTWGSLLAVGFYALLANWFGSYRYTASLQSPEFMVATIHAAILLALLLYILLGIWAANRSIELLGNTDASQAVVDEVIGQFIVFLFIPFTTSWLLIGAAFLFFRLFDIWKPYPIDSLQDLGGGIGICADDMLAGVYAGVCLAILYAVTLYA